VHNPRFEELSNLDGAADNGCTIFYKYLDYRHPNSKFVLLVRDIESWLESAKHIHQAIPVGELGKDPDFEIKVQRRMLLYETVTFDREKFIDAYHRHHEDIRRYFKNRPNDLLEMDIISGDGWEKLCAFLELPVPKVPFPFCNKRPKVKSNQ